jgi:hypothetical protein
LTPEEIEREEDEIVGVVRDTIFKGERRETFSGLEGSQAVPTYPSDTDKFE